MTEVGQEPYSYCFGEAYRLEPNPLYVKLRAEERVARVRLPYGRDAWLAVGYDAVRQLLSDPRFSRAAAAALGQDVPRVSPAGPRQNAMSNSDPPEHTRLRRLVGAEFTSHRMNARRPQVRRIVDDLLDDLESHGPPADFVDVVTMRLPLLLMCQLLGVPYEDRTQFSHWAVALFSTGYSKEDLDARWMRLHDYVSDLVTRRTQEPADDLLSTLVATRHGSDRLAHEELVSLGVSLLASAHEGTGNQIANFVYLLLTHPDQLAWLREHPQKVPQAVEEMLRFTPLAATAPNAEGQTRVATVDVVLDGVPVAAGEPVLPSIISANRDERVFHAPERLDLTREANRHIAFGYGPHRCLGAAMARIMLQVSITALLARFPRLALAVPAEEVMWKTGMLVRGPKQLPLTW